MKTRYIVLGVITALVLLFIGSILSTKNTAIGYEETINSAKSGIQVQEQREYDLITKLMQVVEATGKFEGETQLGIAKARTALKNGDVASAQLAINAVAEQYPQLRTTEAYTQLMTELSVSENLKAQYRSTYNDTILEYRRFVRRTPNDMILGWVGYKVIEFDYLQFNETALPNQLFSNP